MMRNLLLGTLCLTALRAQTAGTIDFNREVHAILATRCLGCHSQEKRSGGLSLATYDDVLNGGRSGAIVRPGKSADSLIVQRLNGPASTRMPLGGTPLSTAEIGVITTWIDQGARPAPTAAAAKPRWEPPMALIRPKPPAASWKGWDGPLDRFTAAYLSSHAIEQVESVSDAVFARRAYLDAWGLLPTPDELRAFLADNSVDKRPRLVDRLLADNKRYTEHWISFWNDLLRNEDGASYVSETGGRRSITPWLLEALESNLRFDQWVAKLLNPSAPGDPEGFLIGVNWRGAVSASQTPAMQAAQNTAQVFLGVNLKCNSCHDSFISKWKLKDAYSLAAYFSTEERIEMYRCDIAQHEYATAGFLFPGLNRPAPSTSPADRRATIAAIFTDPKNGRMPRTIVNRIWERLMGRGIVENVDEMDGEPWSPELLDALAGDFVAGGYDLKALIGEVLKSRTYQLPAVPRTAESPKDYVFRGPELRRLTAEEFADAVAEITGDWPVTSRAIPKASTNSGTPVVSGQPTDGAQRGTKSSSAQPPGPKPPLVPPAAIAPGSLVREWRVSGSSLDRALGRPLRDQVYSTRDTQATTIQALELVNGERLNHWLWRGARRMLGELPPEPQSLLAWQLNEDRSQPTFFDLDISKSDKLFLIVEDALSTAADKGFPLWEGAEVVGPSGAVPLSNLTPLDRTGIRDDSSAKSGVPVKMNSVVVYDIAGKGFTRFRGTLTFEPAKLEQGENVMARFYVFDRQPTLDRLTPPKPEAPLAVPPPARTVAEAVDRVYWHALGRAPNDAERQVAETALRSGSGKPSADGLADLLWAVLMTPEFQLIR